MMVMMTMVVQPHFVRPKSRAMGECRMSLRLVITVGCSRIVVQGSRMINARVSCKSRSARMLHCRSNHSAQSTLAGVRQESIQTQMQRVVFLVASTAVIRLCRDILETGSSNPAGSLANAIVVNVVSVVAVAIVAVIVATVWQPMSEPLMMASHSVARRAHKLVAM
jgi:hypothetical protein